MTSGDHEGSGARLELRRADAAVETVLLEDRDTTIGRSSTAGICVDDETVSRLHAVVQLTGDAGWRITDLDSTNGTFVNDQRVRADRPLRDRDRIRVGDTELVFRAPATDLSAERRTVVGATLKAPDVTRRERDVLVALCRPLLGRDPFPAPASTREICAELVVTESAVRHHLDRLYDKFGIYDGDPDQKRRELARDAIRRGAVTEQDTA